MPSTTKPEILALLSAAEDEGTVGEDEASLVEDAINFSAIQVRSVMVPRVDVRTIEADTHHPGGGRNLFRDRLFAPTGRAGYCLITCSASFTSRMFTG